MKTITKEELIARINQQEPVQLVMALGPWAYERMHIPGSMSFEDICELRDRLSRDHEVIVYCTNPQCPASYRLYYHLKNLGFTEVVRFAGGIEEWMEAGLQVEGSLVTDPIWQPA